MPALNITFTDDEMATLRTSATAAGTSLKSYTHDTVLAVARDNTYRDLVTAAARRVATKSAELNRRLA